MKTFPKARYLALFLAALLSACSSIPRSPESGQVTDRRIETSFTDEGVKVFYTLTGKLEKIEVAGQAEVWKGNVELQAEADAYAKLVKFLYGSDVSQERRVKVIGRALERAEDRTREGSKEANDPLAMTDKELELDLMATDQSRESSKAALRAAKVVNQQLMTTATSISSRGRLTGVRKVRDAVVQDGKIYVAVFQWSERDQDAADLARSRMIQRSGKGAGQ